MKGFKMSPAFPVSILLFFKKREILLMIGQYFYIQEKDDNQEKIDKDKPLLDQTLLTMESTPSQNNKDIILDVTLFAENLAEVSK